MQVVVKECQHPLYNMTSYNSPQVRLTQPSTELSRHCRSYRLWSSQCYLTVALPANAAAQTLLQPFSGVAFASLPFKRIYPPQNCYSRFPRYTLAWHLLTPEFNRNSATPGSLLGTWEGFKQRRQKHTASTMGKMSPNAAAGRNSVNSKLRREGLL